MSSCGIGPNAAIQGNPPTGLPINTGTLNSVNGLLQPHREIRSTSISKHLSNVMSKSKVAKVLMTAIGSTGYRGRSVIPKSQYGLPNYSNDRRDDAPDVDCISRWRIGWRSIMSSRRTEVGLIATTTGSSFTSIVI